MNKEGLRNLIIVFIVYSISLVFIGRQLSFIPQIKFGKPAQKKVSYASQLRKDVLEKFLKNESGSWSVYFKDIKSGEEFGIDENRMTTGASLNKVPIMAYLYNRAGAGKIDLEDTISVQKEDVQDYGTGSIRYDEPGKAYSLKTLTKLMLEQSDNTAAHVLEIRLGEDNIQQYMRSLGLVSTNMVNNKITAKELGKLYDLLFARQLTTESLTREVLDFSRDTDFEDRLARDLPKSVAVHHKAADGVGFVHDGGIIDDGKSPFVLAVLASDVKNVEHAKETIGKISKFVYDEQVKKEE